MSYCRFSKDSDVYMYPHVMGYIECCGCDMGELTAFDTAKQALLHLLDHIQRGDRVPARACTRLLKEMRDDILQDTT